MDDRYPMLSLTEHPLGVLFGPDLHIDGNGPSTRVDDYASSVLSKVSYCIEVANDENVVASFPGDFFGRARVSSDYVKSKTIEILRKARYLPIIYPGNHDMGGDILGESDTLWLLKASGCAHVQIHSGPTAVFNMLTQQGESVRVGVGGTPYGQDLPKSAEWERVQEHPEDVDLGVWFSHHNLTFQSHYADRPSYDFFEIEGVDSVINGHLHHAAPSVRVGATEWHNPGSCTRTKANERERVPTFGIIWADGAIDIMPIRYDGSNSVFTSSAGRVSAPINSSAPDNMARERFISHLASDCGEEKSVGVLLDEALDAKMIDRPLREWLETIAARTA